MSKIIMKLLSKANVEVYWKTDSFWSLHTKLEYAKVHGNSNSNIEQLIKNFLSNVNYNLDHSTPDSEHLYFYDNIKIGYDFVEEIDICKFNFIKTGPYEYKLKYNKDINKYVLIDMRRKLKLEQIQKIVEEKI